MSGRPAQSTAGRIEDLRWMIETGECLAGAAARLDITEGALERWCARHGLGAEAAVLRDRNPIDPETYAAARDVARAARAAQRDMQVAS